MQSDEIGRTLLHTKRWMVGGEGVTNASIEASEAVARACCSPSVGTAAAGTVAAVGSTCCTTRIGRGWGQTQSPHQQMCGYESPRTRMEASPAERKGTAGACLSALASAWYEGFDVIWSLGVIIRGQGWPRVGDRFFGPILTLNRSFFLSVFFSRLRLY